MTIKLVAAGLGALVLLCGCHGSHLGAAKNASPGSGIFLRRTVVIRHHGSPYTVYLPPGYTPRRDWPIILALHGAGECGKDGVAPSLAGLGVTLRQHPDRFPCVVVFPQTSQALCYWTGDTDQVMAALRQTETEFHGDPMRLYLTGYSLGGAGAWYLAATHPGVFAALVPICGRIAARPERVRQNASVLRLVTSRDPYAAVAASVGDTPVWVFHGTSDPIVPLGESRRMVAALRTDGNKARFTEFPGVGHGSWLLAYDDLTLPEWLLARRLKPR